jgi:hypothetical protein
MVSSQAAPPGPITPAAITEMPRARSAQEAVSEPVADQRADAERRDEPARDARVGAKRATTSTGTATKNAVHALSPTANTQHPDPQQAVANEEPMPARALAASSAWTAARLRSTNRPTSASEVAKWPRRRPAPPAPRAP